jgi:hypothetical protein
MIKVLRILIALSLVLGVLTFTPNQVNHTRVEAAAASKKLKKDGVSKFNFSQYFSRDAKYANYGGTWTASSKKVIGSNSQIMINKVVYYDTREVKSQLIDKVSEDVLKALAKEVDKKGKLSETAKKKLFNYVIKKHLKGYTQKKAFLKTLAKFNAAGKVVEGLELLTEVLEYQELGTAYVSGSGLVTVEYAYRNRPYESWSTHKSTAIWTSYPYAPIIKSSYGKGVFKPVDKTAPSAPKADPVTNKTVYLKGKAEANSYISIKLGRKEIGKGKTTSKGIFTIKIPTQKAGNKLSITAKDASKNVSKATSVTVLDKVPPSIPKADAANDKTIYIKGTAEAYSTVSIKSSGKVIGTGKASSKGIYTIKIPVQKAGTILTITAKDAAGNVSGPKNLTINLSPVNVTGKWIYNSNQLLELTQKGNTVEGILHTEYDGLFWDLPVKGTISGNQVVLHVYYNNADTIFAAAPSSDVPYNVAVQASKVGLSTKITFTAKDGVDRFSASYYPWYFSWSYNSLTKIFNGGDPEAAQYGVSARTQSIQRLGSSTVNVTGNWLYQGTNKISLKQEGYKVTGTFNKGQLIEPIEGRVYGNHVYLRIIDNKLELITDVGAPLAVANLLVPKTPSSLIQYTYENGKTKFDGEYFGWYVRWNWNYQIEAWYNGGSSKNKDANKSSITMEKQ